VSPGEVEKLWFHLITLLALRHPDQPQAENANSDQKRSGIEATHEAISGSG
jgi:hypothetical protein